MEMNNKLPLKFFQKDVHSTARNLLGKYFVRKIKGKILSGKIVEVEAYHKNNDESSHSFNGKTKRNEIMFWGGGYLYIYFTYGMHFCANVVTGKLNEGAAILLRSLEPIEGLDIMAMNRYNKSIINEIEKRNLTNGPAKICRAFDIKRNENGTLLTGDKIFILNAPKISSNNIEVTTRIGIKKSIDLPWRYYIKDNPFVSKK